ncbi:MAG: RidA family protein, partial [Gaiellaceae bacterium]
PPPVMTLNPVPLQPWPGQEIQLQAIALRGWRRDADVRVVTSPVPEANAAAFDVPVVTDGLRAGEFYAVGGQIALDDDGRIAGAGDGVAQTHAVMARLGAIQKELGASFQDAVKKEGYYFGTTMDEWAAMAALRATYFREPAAVATVVPCHALWPEGALTKVEVLGMRAHRNGFDKYIPREDRWPERVWDWPIPVPYRQGIRLRDTIWTGGQVPWEPKSNSGHAMHPGDVIAQARFVMSYIEDILRAFEATTGDLRWLVCYFASTGTTEETHRFVEAVDDCVAGPLPPLTVVPQPHLHSDDTRVEIWGVADATRGP